MTPKSELEGSQSATAQGQAVEDYVNSFPEIALHKSTPITIRSILTPEEIQRLRRESLERAVARNLPPSTSDFRREDIYDDDEGR